MATATIASVAVEVTTDLGTTPDVGPSLRMVSASQFVTADVYHRINPYFYRISKTTEPVKVEFSCEHDPLDSVAYAEVDGEPQSHTWNGTMIVNPTRTRRTKEAIEQRQITAIEVPSAAVPRAIVCSFEVVERRNTRTQQWETLPAASSAPPACNVDFNLMP